MADDLSTGIGAATQIGSAIPFIGGAIGAAGNIFQLVNAASQNKKADQLQSQYQRPTRTISPAMQQAMSIYQNLAGQRMMPGQQNTQNQIGANTAQGIRAISQTADSPAAQLAAISGLVGKQNDSYNNLGAQAAQWQNQNQQNLAGFNAGAMNTEQQNNWQYNQYAPYAAAGAAASSLRGAAMQNQNNAVQGLSNVFINSLKGYQGLGTKNTNPGKLDTSMVTWGQQPTGSQSTSMLLPAQPLTSRPANNIPNDIQGYYPTDQLAPNTPDYFTNLQDQSIGL